MSTSPSPAASADVVSVAVNFSGSWRSSGHSGMAAFLRSQGFPEANANLAAAAVVTQKIVHTHRQLVVTVGDRTTAYSILVPAAEANAAEEEEAQSEANPEPADLAAAFLENTAAWVDAPESEGAGAARRLATSTGDIDQARWLTADGRMIVEVTATTADGPVTARTTFDKIEDDNDTQTDAAQAS